MWGIDIVVAMCCCANAKGSKCIANPHPPSIILWRKVRANVHVSAVAAVFLSVYECLVF